MAKRTSDVPPNALLADLNPAGVHFSWPLPVSYRLDQFVDRARRARTDRGEVAAAIIAAAHYTDDELVALIWSHREKRAHEVVLDVEPGADVIRLPLPKPGRRRARQG